MKNGTISAMNLVQREFLLCEWSSFGLSQHCCLKAGLIETGLFIGKFLM